MLLLCSRTITTITTYYWLTITIVWLGPYYYESTNTMRMKQEAAEATRIMRSCDASCDIMIMIATSTSRSTSYRSLLLVLVLCCLLFVYCYAYYIYSIIYHDNYIISTSRQQFFTQPQGRSA